MPDGDLTELANNMFVALASQGWSISVDTDAIVVIPPGGNTVHVIPMRVADHLFTDPELEPKLMAWLAYLVTEDGFVWPYPPDQYGDVHGETPPTA